MKPVGDHPRGSWHALHLEFADLAAFRQSNESHMDAARRHIEAACIKYLTESHRGGLSADELHDITVAALIDEWHRIIAHDLPIEDVSYHLQKALDRHKKRSQRHTHRILLRDVTDLPGAYVDPPLADIHHALAVVSKIEHFMEEALDRIEDDAEHDALVRDLELHELGIPLRRPSEPADSSEEYHRAVLVRARRTMRRHLEELLEAALKRGVGDIQVIQDARRLLHRGTRAVKQALQAAQELQDPPPAIDP